MVKVKPNLSDWILVLSDNVRSRENFYGTVWGSIIPTVNVMVSIVAVIINVFILAVIFAEKGVTLAYQDMLGALVGLLVVMTVTNLCIVLYSAWERSSGKSKFNRTVQLLREIMKGELRDTRKISDRYFEIYPDRKKEIKGK